MWRGACWLLGMGTYSSGIDGVFDSMSLASADSTSPPTLRPVSSNAERAPTQPSIHVVNMNAAAERRRSKSTSWRLPVLVWSTVLLAAVAARGTIVHSVGSLGSWAPKAAAASAGVASASSSAPVLVGPSRVFPSSHELLRVEREQPAETAALASRTPAPTGAKARIKPKMVTARRAQAPAPAAERAPTVPAGAADEMAAAAAVLAQAKTEQPLD